MKWGTIAMKTLFSTSLFGYSKKSVRDYISSMNEEFSQKALAKEEEFKTSLRAMREEIEQLRQENERLLAQREEVAGALIDAKQFAADLIGQAEREGHTLRARNSASYQAECQRLQAYAAQINSLRDRLHASIQAMDEEMEQYNAVCQTLLGEGSKACDLSEEIAPEKETAV